MYMRMKPGFKDRNDMKKVIKKIVSDMINMREERVGIK